MAPRPPEVLRGVRNMVLTVIGFWVAIGIAALLIFRGAEAIPALLGIAATVALAVGAYRAHRAFVAWWDGTGKDLRG